MVEKEKKLVNVEHQCHHHRVKPSQLHSESDTLNDIDIVPVMTTSPNLINRGVVPDIPHHHRLDQYQQGKDSEKDQQPHEEPKEEEQSLHQSVEKSKRIDLGEEHIPLPDIKSSSSSSSFSIPLSMEAIVINDLNREQPWQSLIMVQQYPTPTIQYHVQSDQVLVKMYAASVNELFDGSSYGKMSEDVPQLFTHVHLSAHRLIAGRDGSGQVIHMGTEAQQYWKNRIAIGDHVLGIMTPPSSFTHVDTSNTYGGTFAQYAVFHYRNIARRPMALSWQQCAALPVASLSIWNCFRHVPSHVKNAVQRRKPLRVLILGAETGPGSLAVLLAKYYFHADMVYAACSNHKDVPYVRQLLSDNDHDDENDSSSSRVIDMDTEMFEQVIQKDVWNEEDEDLRRRQIQMEEEFHLSTSTTTTPITATTTFHRSSFKGFVNVVIDTVGGYELWKRSCDILDHESYFCSIVQPRELLAEDTSILDVLKFEGTIIMEKLKHWTMDHPKFYCLSKTDNSDGALEHLADFFANKMNKIHITEFDMLEAKRAHELFYCHDLAGKIVLNIDHNHHERNE